MRKRGRLLFVLIAFVCAARAGSQEAIEAKVRASRVGGVEAPDIVFTAQDIANFSSMEDLLSSVQFLQVSKGSGGYGSVMVSARGSSGDNPFSQVQFRVDGIVINNPDMTPVSLISVPLSSIAEVRVYDGGSGSRFGNGSVGATVEIITRQETEPSFGFGAGWGLRNSGEGYLHGGYATERWGVDGYFSASGEDGFRANGGGQVYAGGLNTRVDLSDRWMARASAKLGFVRAGNPGSIYEGDPITTSYNLEDEYRAFESSFLASADYEDSRLRASIPLAVVWKHREFDYPSNLAYSSDPSSTYWFVQTSFSPSAEMRIGRAVIGFGADSSFTYYVGEQWEDLDRSSLDFDYSMRQFTVSPYGSFRYRFSDRLSVEAGARYDFTAFGAEKEASGVSASDAYHNAAFDVSVEYSPFAGNKAYASIGSVYRIPFLDEKASLTGWGDGVNFDLESEKGVQGEIGWKGRMGSLSYSASAFVLYMADEIGYAYNSVTGTGQNENYDDTLRIGGTASLSHDPFRFFGYSLGFTYVDGRFVRGDYAGNFIPNLSPWKATASVHSRIDRVGLFVRVHASVEGSKYMASDKANEGEMTGVVPLIGIDARWDVPGLDRHRVTFGVSVRNLLNWEYDSYAMYSYGTVYRYPADPLTFKAWCGFEY